MNKCHHSTGMLSVKLSIVVTRWSDSGKPEQFYFVPPCVKEHKQSA